jgi:hypothetical protein
MGEGRLDPAHMGCLSGRFGQRCDHRAA